MNIETLSSDLESARSAHGAAVAAGGDTADDSRKRIAKLAMQLADAEALAEHERAEAEAAAIAQDRADRADALDNARRLLNQRGQQASRLDAALAEAEDALSDLVEGTRAVNRERVLAGLKPLKGLGTSAIAGAVLASAPELSRSIFAARPPLNQRRQMADLSALSTATDEVTP